MTSENEERALHLSRSFTQPDANERYGSGRSNASTTIVYQQSLPVARLSRILEHATTPTITTSSSEATNREVRGFPLT